MSSELTIDIQLTELGFSSWDFQVLKQKETQQTSELDYASSSSSSSLPGITLPVEVTIEEKRDEGHLVSSQSVSIHDSQLNASSVHVDSTESSAGQSSSVCEEEEEEEESGLVEEKPKRSWNDGNADEQLKETKKQKTRKDQGNKWHRTKREGQMDVADASEEEENEEDEEVNDDVVSDEEEYDVALSSDSNSSEEHQCQVCKLTFPTTFLLHEHLHIHNGVRLYHCAECNKQFCHLVNYRRHLRAHAQAPGIRCIVCTARFPTQEDLQQHLDTNHFEDKFYQCDLCKRIFTNMAKCRKHVQSHRQRTKRYPCPKCERSFRHHSSMLYHLKRHKKGVFLCTDCGLAFSTKGVLLRHSFHHLGLLPYTCIRCKRHFRLSSQYLKHECKPEQLQCEACLVIFPSEEEFLKHKKDTGCWGDQRTLNTKTNDIRCMECGQVFSSSEELKKHAGTHQRILRCSECGMGFRSSIMLMSHMAGHVAQRPCLCKECGLGFCHQQGYDSHLKTCGREKPAEIALKKQKSELKKKNAVTTAKIEQTRIAPRLVHLQPNALSVQPAEVPTTFTLNKEPISPLPLVMLLPAPSTSASTSIPNTQTLTSNVSKKSASAPQVNYVSLPSNCSAPKESDKTVVLKDLSQPAPASNVLMPVTSVKNAKTGWTLLDGAGTSAPVTKIIVIKKKNTADINSKPLLQNPQLHAKLEPKKGILSNLQILQVLDMIKKNVCNDKTKLNQPPSHVIPIKADKEKQEGLKLDTSKPLVEQRSGAALTKKILRDDLSAVNMQPRHPDTAAVKDRPEQDQSSKASIDLSNTQESKNNLQNINKHTEEEVPVPDSAAMESVGKSEVVQCETCGEMILETKLAEHTIKHSASSVPATS
ncbi:Zinc finger imprinted 3 [Bagarius yarrelli]|uniref:Zinc finger imprinted 3 n=1 Tax=Bagarius yarrelli TaxID=175774 RepID=A0A556U186_BAGYA|nr:Zinc finger imprinted 3 [Bagarius yarrelli]